MAAKQIPPLSYSYSLARRLFLRLLGVIYLIAFASLWLQIKGLVGSNGILPTADFLAAVAERIGPERYRLLPTIFWLNAGGQTGWWGLVGTRAARPVRAGVVTAGGEEALMLFYEDGG